MSIIPNTISSSLAEISRENPAFLGNQASWKETPEAHVLQADLPGLRKEELKVQVEDGGILTISGERSVQREDASATGHRVECSSGKFSRRFTLPENARIDQVQASMDNDVLTVTVPKKEVTAKAIENSN